MTDIEFSDRAKAELLDIYLFGYRHFGKLQADRYIDGFENIFRLLAANPRMGRRADAIAKDIGRHEHDSHVVLYEEIARGVRIVAIVHAHAVGRLRL